ncbi:transposase, partial [Paenibacillus elgii]
ITEEARERFFRLQGRRRAEKEYWAYDTTTLSSYSECLKQVKYGMNKEHDPLPQINLALLFGEQSNLPFYYRKLPGNISDVQTVKKLLADMDFFTYKKIKLVMDRGFYSEANINAMYQHHLKFLIGVKVTLKYVQEELES